MGEAVAWLGAAGAAAMGVLALLPAANTGRWACLCGAAMCAGLSLGVSATRSGFPPGATQGVARLVGRVASAPRETAVGADVLAGLAHGSASLVFELEVEGVQRGDATYPASAAVIVRVEELGTLPPRGTRVRVTGWYRPPGRALNPGSRASTGDGSLAVARVSSVERLDSPHDSPLPRLRLAADAALTASFPAWATPSWRALVKAMTSGVREPALVAPGAEFRMAGMSHILAISGFNVAVLVGVGAAVAASLGAGFSVRALAALATSLLFLLVTEPEVSVLRAGLGAGIAALAGIRGGRARGLGTLGAVAMITLLLDPTSLFSAGFQLSYGVVLGLLTLASAPAERWQARVQAIIDRVPLLGPSAHEHVSVMTGWFVTACASSVVAFTVSTPIALWHGGFVSTYAAPISVFTMPAAALVTIGGVAAIAVGSVFPPAAVVPGSIACGCAAFLAWVARAAADWPCTTWWIGRPAMWWVVAAVAAVVAMWVAPRRWQRCAAALAVCGLAALAWNGPARPHGDWPRAGELRVESLDVGNGACVLVRSHTHAILYDAGTSSDDSAGSRRVVPALAALGVRRIDAIVLSHDRLAHHSAVPEVCRAFDATRVIASGNALDAPSRSLRAVGTWLRARGIEPEPHQAGDAIVVGDIQLEALWPYPKGHESPSDRAGDASLVLRVALAESVESVEIVESVERGAGKVDPPGVTPRAVMLLGGLEPAGCDALRRQFERQSARVAASGAGADVGAGAGEPACSLLVLPRGRGDSEALARLVATIQPRATIATAERTAEGRPGAQRVDILADGAVLAFTWTQSGWRALDEHGALQAHHVADR